MTIYDLTQAFKRYKTPVLVALGLLIVGVVVMTFTIQDGKPAFRASVTYESSVQIAVVPPGTDSLISSENSTANLASAATLYASLLESDEAARWIGDQNGYKLEEAVSTNVERGSTIIVATVTAPTSDQSRSAALSTFDWLNKRLLEPIETANFPTPPTTIPVIVLDGPFTSFINVDVNEDLASAPDDLFMTIETDGNEIVTVPLQPSAGRTIRVRSTLDPFITLVVTLQTASDEPIDSVRVAPPTAPRAVEFVPELSVAISDASFRTTRDDEGNPSADLIPDEIELAWLEGTAAANPEDVETIDVDLALLTTEPGFTTTGGRRGPILAITAMVVGLILILTIVVVADTWRRQRDAQTVIHVSGIEPGSGTAEGSKARTTRSRRNAKSSKAGESARGNPSKPDAEASKTDATS